MKKKMTPMKSARVAVNISGSMLTTKYLLTTIAAPEIKAVIIIRAVPHNSFVLVTSLFIIFRKVRMYLKFPSIKEYESARVWKSVS